MNIKILTKKSSRRLKASCLLQKDAKAMPLLSATYFGVRFFEEIENLKVKGKIAFEKKTKIESFASFRKVYTKKVCVSFANG